MKSPRVKCFGRKPDGTIVQVNATVGSYFSFTTQNGPASQEDVEFIPELKDCVSLHLADARDGTSMYAIANGAYFISKEDYKAVANLFHVDEEEAMRIISFLRWKVRSQIEDKRDRVTRELSKFKRTLTELGPLPKQGSFITLENYLEDVRRFIRKELNLRLNLVGFSKKPLDPKFYQNGEVPAFVTGMGEEGRKHFVEFLVYRNHFGRPHSLDELNRYRKMVPHLLDLIEKFKYKVPLKYCHRQYQTADGAEMRELVREYIADHYAEGWKAKADECRAFIEGHAGSEYYSTTYTDNCPRVEVATLTFEGRQYPIKEFTKEGFLPTIDVGGLQFYVALNGASASEAVGKYYKDMAENDVETLACMFGNDAIVKWALGQPAKINGHTYHSFGHFVEAAKFYPENVFASYDGKQREAWLNPTAFHKIFDKDLDHKKPIEVLIYRI